MQYAARAVEAGKNRNGASVRPLNPVPGPSRVTTQSTPNDEERSSYMANDTHEVGVQLLDNQTTVTNGDAENSASPASCNAQAERPVSVPSSLLEQPKAPPCVTCGAACTQAIWMVPKFLGGGWACRREHVGAGR